MKLSKSEKKRIRMEQNKEWQLLYKSKGVEKDLNPRYSLYYHLQLPELNGEWNQLVEIMKKGLPATFRISERCNFFVKKALSKRLEQHYRSLRGKFVQMKGEAVVGNLLDPVPWAPSTYQMTVDNFTISHEVSLREFSNFLSREVDLGHIVRQELVSMIPALLLDVHHSHTILDCCAAPGSKTEQLLSLMKHSARKEGFSPELPIQGTVVANDADSKRIQTLIDRFHKLNSPNILFTCMNAESFASIFSTNDNRIESFDRILCDVPCTGDGTFRKCPYLWRLFRPRSGLQIHEVQLNIVTEAVKLLKPGGKLVYSTCSLNPIEDEAVVTALLRHYDGYLKLVDSNIDERLPGLKYRKGINCWHTDIDSFLVGETDPIERKTSQDRLPTLGSTIVPPQNESEIKKFNLDKSIRIVPHDQNTGGFFIAVFEKIQSTESFTSNSFSKNNNSLATKTKNFFDDLAEPTIANQDIDSLQITKKQKKSKDSDKSTSGEKLMKELGYNPKQSEAKSDQFTSLKTLVFDEIVDPRSILDDQAASKTLHHTLFSYLPLIAASEDEEEIQKKSLCLISLKTVSEDEYKLVLVSSHTYRAIKRWNISIPLIHGGITLGNFIFHFYPKINIYFDNEFLDLSSNSSLYSYHAMSMLSKNLLPLDRGTFNLSNNDFLNIFQQTMRAIKGIFSYRLFLFIFFLPSPLSQYY